MIMFIKMSINYLNDTSKIIAMKASNLHKNQVSVSTIDLIM